MPRDRCVQGHTDATTKKKTRNDTERSRNARGIEEMGNDPFLNTQASAHDQFTHD